MPNVNITGVTAGSRLSHGPSLMSVGLLLYVHSVPRISGNREISIYNITKQEKRNNIHHQKSDIPIV